MNRILTFILFLTGTQLLIVSCGQRSAKDYAAHFCSCSEELSKASIQFKNGLIDQTTFQQIQEEHAKCMGEDDPLEKLKDNPDAQHKFKTEFIQELEKSCPEIARNMGF